RDRRDGPAEVGHRHRREAVHRPAPGLLQLGAGALMAFLIAFGWAWNNRDPRAVVLVFCAATIFLGLSLVTPGVLALFGRAPYLEWREVNAPSKKSSRRDDDF